MHTLTPQWDDSPNYQLPSFDGRAFSDTLDVVVDVLILNQEPRWWSMRELTTGTTKWPPAKARRAPTGRR